ncbi:MAG: Rrf2 family transcriptional regulator [Kiritimatiellae bacterium]|nr:Rrf2 family transcriptional regulator [Kiritimatiellia bacterium]
MISNRCHYALRAMLELALREGAGPVTIADIATAQKIPARFLEAIMRQLKQAGLADSMRGKEGGYFLARPATKIHIGDVLAIFEGPLFTDVEQRGPHAIVDTQQDVFTHVWRDAEAALKTLFSKSTFARIAEQERKHRYSASPDYSI